jgi:hypothetical protein
MTKNDINVIVKYLSESGFVCIKQSRLMALIEFSKANYDRVQELEKRLKIKNNAK